MNIKTINRKILFILNKINISEQIYNNYIVDDGIYIPKNDKDLDINEENKLVIFDYKKVYSSDNTDYIYIHIHKFNRYITNNINKLCIKTINGRFGNKLIQYCNCIYFALKHNINIVEFNEPIDFMKERTIVLGDYKKRNTYTLSKYWVSWKDLHIKSSPNNISSNIIKNEVINDEYEEVVDEINDNIDTSYSLNSENSFSGNKGYERDIELFGISYKYIMNKYVKYNLTLNCNDHSMNNHSMNKILTIHVRGIDTKEHSIPNSYIRYMSKTNYFDTFLKLPLSFYIKIITTFKFNNIHIITESLDLSIVNMLEEYCNNNNINVIIQSKSMKEDLEAIIKANYLILSKSSFCSMMTSFLNDNAVVFTPKVGDYIYCKNLLKSVKNVICIDL